MWWLLMCLFSLADCRGPQEPPEMERPGQEELHIRNCRSRNMEDFTCWWSPLRNISDEDHPTYILTYTKDKGPERQCPDYVTKGPNSCYFDKDHTSIWMIYCLTVTAVTVHGNYTSEKYCLDVSDIVQTEAPVELAYKLEEAGGDEMGYNVLLTWAYPVPSDLQFGWITLLYELHYRRMSEPDNWKGKQSQREASMKLQCLAEENYVVRVRCRSQHSGLWSQWSSELNVSLPTKSSTVPGKQLALILVTGVSVVALLMIGFGIIPHSKRIKACFLSPIPKPKIMGIDPLLLKKGCMPEIDSHFRSFHGYSPPSYVEEVWHQVAPENCSCADPPPEGAGLPTALEEKVIGAKATEPPPASEAVPWPLQAPHPSPHDFYTCVLTNASGEVHLVPCLTPAPPTAPLPYQAVGGDASGGAKELVDHLPRKVSVAVTTTTDAADRGKGRNGEEDTLLLLPVGLTTTAE